jgi:hypothetical protein
MLIQEILLVTFTESAAGLKEKNRTVYQGPLKEVDVKAEASATDKTENRK